MKFTTGHLSITHKEILWTCRKTDWHYNTCPMALDCRSRALCIICKDLSKVYKVNQERRKIIFIVKQTSTKSIEKYICQIIKL